MRMSGNSDLADAADADLVRRAAAGDKDAFAVMFERYQHVVYRFARAMTGCPDVAADVTQEVFVILIRDLKRYEPERAAFSTYLYGVARNVSRDRLRRQNRFLSFLARGQMPTDDDRQVDPFQRMATAETGAEMRRALAQVPVRFREVVILRDLHDLSYTEVATLLGLSIGAVRSRLHRGRRLLREQLSQTDTMSVRRAVRSSLRCSV
jgi:RNA polymerase sigma-70 factor (ECF subfamily)